MKKVLLPRGPEAINNFTCRSLSKADTSVYIVSLNLFSDTATP